jgi:hypothetical protein
MFKLDEFFAGELEDFVLDLMEKVYRSLYTSTL